MPPPGSPPYAIPSPGMQPGYGMPQQGFPPSPGMHHQAPQPGMHPHGGSPVYGIPLQGGPPPGMPPQSGGQTVYGMPPQGGQPGYGMPPQGGQPGYGMPPQGGQPGYGMPPQGGQPGYGMPPQGGQPVYEMHPQGSQPGYGIPPQGGPPPGMPPKCSQPPGAPPQMQRYQPGDGGKSDLDDVSDDEDEQAPKARPVGEDAYVQFQGYEQVGDYHAKASVGPPPPAMMPQPPQGEPPHMLFKNTADISEREARLALLAWVDKECCFGKGCAEDMVITSIQPSVALHSYCESRTTCRSHEAYEGQFVDGSEYGYPPPPWTIACQPDALFEEQEKEFEVPHTAYLKECHHCHSRGFCRCLTCHGRGDIWCDECWGDGWKNEYRDGMEGRHRCRKCGGDGRYRCRNCGGDGKVVCPVCKGFRILKHFILLTVDFAINSDDHIVEETDMPDELVRNVGGIVIFQQTLPMVWPIVSYPLNEINLNSQALVQSHRSKFNDKRILHQRQTLRAVPVTEVAYAWKDIRSRFWVYGQEKQVHCPDYPQQCCCGCSIL